VLAKFTQHDELSALLLSTGDSKLVEHTENDDYWGDGGDGSGKNMLGRILMQVRESLRLSQVSDKFALTGCLKNIS
jgi:N-glycosidase YbiA